MHFTILNEKNLSESPAQREVVPREIPLTQVQEWHDASTSSTSAASGDASVPEKSVAFQILFFLRGISQYCNIYDMIHIYIYIS